MANTIRIKRRASSGGAGAPTTLENAELAFNESSNILYYGTGTGGSGGSATSIIAIGGNGAFVDTSTTQTVGGTKTFSNTITGSVSGNAGTATTLATGRTIAITGDLSYTSGSFNGSANVTGTGTLANSGVTAGTYTKITVDAKGRATVGATASLSDLSAPTGALSIGSQLLTNVATPVSDTDGANKGYVDSVAQGLDTKASCVVATTANITLSGTQTIDGIAVIAGDRVLVKNQTATADNGIYVVSASAWARSSDMNLWEEFPSAYTFIEQGSTQADTGWVCTVNAGGTLGTTPVTFTQFSGAGTYVAGNGLTLTGNSFAVTPDGTSLSVSSGGVRINSTYTGQTSITTLGTIGTGTWQGTQIADAYLAGISGSKVSGDITGNAGNVTGTVAIANGGTGATTNTNARTNLGATTLGSNLFTITNPSAITFPRFNADNSVSSLSASDFRTAIGAGTGTGTVTSVALSGGTTGLSTSGSPITTSGTITLAGTLVVGNGGTGATTLTGYVKGNGTSAMTASATIPNTDISGLGTMSTQNAGSVAITGGSITNLTTFDGITIDGGTY
jgi:hypothetical protein